MAYPYFCEYDIQAMFDGVNWENISSDVLDVISWKYGILGSSILERVGDPGEMKIVLNNGETNSAGLIGYYTPKHSNCRSGFAPGLLIRITVTYLGLTRTKFYGKIPSDGISVVPGRYAKHTVSVTVRDWMYQASIHEMNTPEFAEDKNQSEIVALILANMTVQPLHVTYTTPTEIFNCVFDKITTKTKSLAEFAKVALSELGFIYITRSETYDEILMVEGRYARNDTPDLTKLPSAPIYTNYVDESGNYFVDESGNKFYFYDYEEVEAIFDNSMMAFDAPYGKEQYNIVKCTAYPRIIDASATTVLFSLSKAISLAAGETKEFKGSYKDPSGLYDDVAITDPVSPTATTDYLFNTAEDGSGTDITANLTVTAVYGAKEVAYTVTSSYGSTGYITKLNARGKGIYSVDPISVTVQDTDSIEDIGPSQITLDMKYQDDATYVLDVANLVLSKTKEPNLIPEKVTFCANRSSLLMNAFMSIEPGNRVRIYEEITGTENDYFVNGVEVEIMVGGLILFTWYIRAAGFDSYEFGYWDEDNWDGSGVNWAL